MSHSPCPTCGCTLYEEHGPCKGEGLLRSALTGLELLQLEANYDPQLLRIIPGLPRVIEEIKEAIK
jgi:hypothetical protein